MEPPATLDAMRFRHVLRTAERWLERNREAVNAINVYPVPDGDTGTNMVLTLRTALDACEPVEGPAVGPHLEAAARGALLGARGNSGVILSQILRGLAEPLMEAQEVDATLLRKGLSSAATSAYSAVVEPVEGTMLTVMREAAEAAAASSGRRRRQRPPVRLRAGPRAGERGRRAKGGRSTKSKCVVVMQETQVSVSGRRRSE